MLHPRSHCQQSKILHPNRDRYTSLYNDKKAIVLSPGTPMIPGEIFTPEGTIELNADRPTLCLTVANTGDRPIQVGSHFHFFEVNVSLTFDRQASRGMRLDIPAGTAVRFEPGDEREVRLIPFVGSRQVYGFNAKVNGQL